MFIVSFSTRAVAQVECLSKNNGSALMMPSEISSGSTSIEKCYTIPVTFHFNKSQNGIIHDIPNFNPDVEAGGLIDYLNQEFNEHQIYFELAGYHEYQIQKYYNLAPNNISQPIEAPGPDCNIQDFFEQIKIENTFNIVFFDENAPSRDIDGEYFYSGFAGIVMGIGEEGLFCQYDRRYGSTLIHEVGNNFGLFHTHHGTNKNGIVLEEGGGAIEENVNGSNCSVAGDYCCDTPLDPAQYNSACSYSGPIQFSPDIDNYMSYNNQIQSCRTSFTPDQVTRMKYHIENQPWYINMTELSYFDLAIKDNADDYFAEPNWTTSDYDNSPDIWVRNNNYGNTNLHQEPIFNDPVWGDPDVKVRVYNNGCAPNTGTETLTVYWAAPSTWQGWPDNWNPLDITEGGSIGTVSVPVIQPGQSTVVSIHWDSDDMPSLPIGTSINTCVLAKVDGGINDPLHSEPHDIWVYSNHVALRNLTYISYASAIISDINPEDYEYPGDYGLIKGFVVENIQPFNDQFDFDITTDPLLLQEAEFYYEVPSELYNHVLNNTPIPGVRPHKTISNALLISSPQVSIEGFTLNANQRLKVKPGINFLRSEVNHDNFTFKFSQRKHGESNILGSEHYIVQRTERAMFQANSGSDVRVLKGQAVHLLAEDIGENAEYHWFDCDGNLLYSGQDITLTPEESRALQLEVITTSDKYKDYDQKNIVVTDGLICNISPNPASILTEVCVELSEGTSSAVLMVYNVNHNLVHNYIVQGSGETQVQLDLSNYTQGTYQVVLIIDGVVSDMHNIIKQ